ALGLSSRVRVLGFVNQSQLPAIYTAADVFVLASEYDPCPAVVCEAMLCSTPVILSDEIHGRFDLVEHGRTGFIYCCSDVDALAIILREVLPDRARLTRMGSAARERMETWSPRENVEGHVQAVSRILARRSPLGLEPALSKISKQ
ncbi:MAG TPA: glycosyltransferase family 4 protein, partial [Candidatus Acidoferrales bacterium]|nr:glycosyltransferase family 4 protein [Candidatus Acidoferrales bacterium]